MGFPRRFGVRTTNHLGSREKDLLVRRRIFTRRQRRRLHQYHHLYLSIGEEGFLNRIRYILGERGGRVWK